MLLKLIIKFILKIYQILFLLVQFLLINFLLELELIYLYIYFLEENK